MSGGAICSTALECEPKRFTRSPSRSQSSRSAARRSSFSRCLCSPWLASFAAVYRVAGCASFYHPGAASRFTPSFLPHPVVGQHWLGHARCPTQWYVETCPNRRFVHGRCSSRYCSRNFCVPRANWDFENETVLPKYSAISSCLKPST